YDKKKAGLVVNCTFSRNILENNNLRKDGSGADEEVPEITVNRCRSVRFYNNTVTRETKGPLIYSDMGKKYTANLKFKGNLYQTKEADGPVTFHLFSKQNTGIRAFNKATGGTDKTETIP
ncbi:MAG: hypothetical protein IKN57_04120, partial [Parasporobacterium sp.]|nr:hypothetical protein [Parasporobacterium sp.]